MKYRIKFAIIDDGINPSEFCVLPVNENLTVSKNGVITKVVDEAIPVDSHGTLCAAIFNKYLMFSDVFFISIKILNNTTETGTINQLRTAIQWCNENGVDLINCSFGTTCYSDFDVVKELFGEIINKGTIIVSALNNWGIYSLPACMNSVIGVKSSHIYKDGMYKLRWYPFDNCEISTSGIHRIIKKNGEVFVTSNSNSFAAPVISALVANILIENGKLSYDHILLKLQEKARTIQGEYLPGFIPYIWNSSRRDFPQNITLFSYDKYNYIIRKYIDVRKREIDIPILNVYGESYDLCLQFIHILVEKLKGDSFHPQVITEYIDELKFSFLLFPNDLNKNIFCSNVDKKFRCDILLTHQFDSFECDINVQINDSINITNSEEPRGLRIFKLTEFNESVEYLLQVLA